MVKRIITGLVLLLALTGCGKKINEGTVINKWYEHPRDYVLMMPIVMSTGKTTMVIVVPIFFHDDEDYCIRIYNHDEEGNEIHRTFYLSKEAWEPIEQGDYFVMASKEQTSDRPMKRRLSDSERNRAQKEEPKERIERVF